MKAYGIQTGQVGRVIQELGYAYRRGHAGGVAVMSGERAACPHMYAEVIEAVLRRYPHARIETAITTYYGHLDFLERSRETLAEALRQFPCKIDHEKED